jgi:DNA-binding beta-propeller fold protein YncE
MNGTLANSSFQVGNAPIDVAVNPAANLLYVANYSDDTVTYLDATTGAPVNGTLANSSFQVGDGLLEVAVNPAANLLYVANETPGAFSPGTVTYLDATTGAYMNGTLANSTFQVGDEPRAVAVNPAANLLYVTDRIDDTVTYLDATTGDYMNGTLANSTFPAGNSPWDVAVNPAANLLYVANRVDNTVSYLDATTGRAFAVDDICYSTFQTGNLPSAIAVVNPID